MRNVLLFLHQKHKTKNNRVSSIKSQNHQLVVHTHRKLCPKKIIKKKMRKQNKMNKKYQTKIENDLLINIDSNK